MLASDIDNNLDYCILLADQDGKCAMCGLHIDDNLVRFHVDHDHDHDTGVVRGLLCGPCNLQLGVFESIRRAAEAYLE